MATLSHRIALHAKSLLFEANAQICGPCKEIQPVRPLSLGSFLLVEPQLHQGFPYAHRLLPHRDLIYTDYH